MAGTTANSSSMSSVGGWKVEPRNSITSSGSAASTHGRNVAPRERERRRQPDRPGADDDDAIRAACYCGGAIPAAFTDAAKFSLSP